MTYQYQSLAPVGQIRLLLLQPGSSSDPLVIKIVHAQVLPDSSSAERSYEAISYRWGGPEEQIQCLPAGTLSIHGNIANALRRFRRQEEERALWTDEICINQVDKEEKSTQIQQMGTIYACASQVLIYLGEWGSVPSEDIAYRDDIKAMGFINDLHSNPLDFFNASTVLSLFRIEWFHRAWVVQEVARSKSAVVVCGSKEVSWERFHQWPSRNFSGMFPGDRWPGILKYSSNFICGDAELLNHLYRNRNAQATNPRDKVFALLNLLSSKDHAKWTGLINYTIPLTDLYIQVAQGILEETRSLRILSAAAGGSSTQLPSWVPDWSCTQRCSQRDPSRQPESLALGQTADERPFNAGGSYGKMNIDLAQGTLTVRGLHVSTVHRRCKRLQSYRVYQHGTPTRKSKDVLLRDFHRHYNYSPEPLTKSSGLRKQVEDLSQFVDIISTASEEPGVCVPTKLILGELEGTANSVVRPPTYVELAKRGLAESLLDPESNKIPLEPWLNTFMERIDWVTLGRGFLETENGYRGLFPLSMLEGDVVVILEGGPVPYVLRPQDSGGFKLVGECYIPGLMQGEILQDATKEPETTKTMNVYVFLLTPYIYALSIWCEAGDRARILLKSEEDGADHIPSVSQTVASDNINMPVTRKIEGPSGREFWSTMSSKDYCAEELGVVAETVKEEFRRPEAAHEIHFAYNDRLPPNIRSTRFGFHCLQDCLVFLLRGVIFLDGSGALVEPGYAYAIKDETMLGLGGNTTIFVMEEGAMKGICAQKTREA
ncbi:hypothetical protein PG984_016670 [Apiospora sp. TS-2023a]